MPLQTLAVRAKLMPSPAQTPGCPVAGKIGVALRFLNISRSPLFSQTGGCGRSHLGAAYAEQYR